MAEPPSTGALAREVRASWDRFIDLVEPYRPDLFRYCRRLTGNAFDAEDLVHDALLRAFGRLGIANPGIANPRAYLLRIASNLWIDEKRRARPESLGQEADAVVDSRAPPDRVAALRDAAEAVLGLLTPRERAAVVLKDVFDLSHAEIGELLSTSEGAIKTALHRGRRRLEAEQVAPRPRPRVSRALVDRFVETFLTYDIEAVKALLIESVEADVFPSGIGTGRDHIAEKGWFWGSFYRHVPAYEAARKPYPLRLQVAVVEGEPVILVHCGHGRGEALEEVWRIEEEDGRVARICDYGFSPDLVRWVAETRGVPFRAVGYRFRPGIYEGGDRA